MARRCYRARPKITELAAAQWERYVGGAALDPYLFLASKVAKLAALPRRTLVIGRARSLNADTGVYVAHVCVGSGKDISQPKAGMYPPARHHGVEGEKR